MRLHLPTSDVDSRPACTPEESLLLAVFHRAWLDLTTPGSLSSDLLCRTIKWFKGEVSGSNFFSYSYIKDVVGFSARLEARVEEDVVYAESYYEAKKAGTLYQHDKGAVQKARVLGR